MRAMQAAKLRASKTALERHDVEIIGSGPELLVFSHGFGYNKNVWSGVIKALDKMRYKIVLYNVTGALGTDYDAFDYQRYSTLHGFTDDLLLLLQELGVEFLLSPLNPVLVRAHGWRMHAGVGAGAAVLGGEAAADGHGGAAGLLGTPSGRERGQQCTVVGQQQAGVVALLASLERPTLFKRIVLLSSSPRLLGAEGYEGSYALEDLDQVFGIMQGNFKLWVRNCAPVLTADDIKAAHVREFVRPLFLLRPDIAFSFLKTAFACDVRDILPRVMVQVHMLFFSGEPTVPESVMQYMLKAIPNAYGELLPTRSLQDSPEIVASSLEKHVSMLLRDPFGHSSRRMMNARIPLPSQEEGEEGDDGGEAGEDIL
ncbi:unnamed protein product [Closterium sp. Yama58-4]|nr:unnamed protein product [Closterium sp. Yama58-4]